MAGLRGGTWRAGATQLPGRPPGVAQEPPPERCGAPLPRQRQRRTVLLAPAGWVGVASAAACTFGGSSGADTGASSQATKPGGTEKRPVRVQQWDTPSTPFGQWLQTYFEAFPAKTGIQTTIVHRKSDVSAAAEQAVWVAGGDVPDVFFRTGRGLVPYAAFASKGVIKPLENLIKRDRWDQSDFWPNLIKLMTARGQQWVIPQDFNQNLFAYNTTLLQQAGVAPPPSDWKDQSWTWNELVRRAQQVQARLGDGSNWAMGRPQGNWQMYLWSNGGDSMNADGTKVTLTAAAAVEALDFVARLMHTHRVAPTPQVTLPPGHALATQSAAMDNLAAAAINAIRGQNRDLEFDVCLPPRGAGRYVAGGGGGGYVLSVTSKQPDAAWELLKYVGAKEYAVNKVRHGALGPRISTAREYFVQAGIPPAHGAVYFDAPGNARWEPNLTNWNDIQVAVEQALQPLWRGEQSAKDAAANAQRAFEALLPQGEVFR